jgi:hypothetical protein
MGVVVAGLRRTERDARIDLDVERDRDGRPVSRTGETDRRGAGRVVGAGLGSACGRDRGQEEPAAGSATGSGRVEGHDGLSGDGPSIPVVHERVAGIDADRHGEGAEDGEADDDDREDEQLFHLDLLRWFWLNWFRWVHHVAGLDFC